MADANLSPLAPAWCRGEGDRPVIPPMAGVSLATAAAGIKYRDRTDLMVMVFDRPVAAAGVFTTSRCASAPVEWCRGNLGKPVRAVVVNSGNANAFTGTKGREACRITADAAAEALGCDPSEIALASTGVIGEPMDASKFAGLLSELCGRVEPDSWWDAAAAIMTTDTYPKAATRTFQMNGITHRIAGIAKGSGMIAPDMATMLAFVVTDAPIAQPDLQAVLAEHVEPTFNSVTVDSDTSTSDTLMVFATGDGEPIGSKTDEFATFGAALLSLFHELSEQLVRDGEGATKHVTVEVAGATSNRSAKTIALAIANSPLVKTAVAGEDANWGRVVMAIGKAGEPADRDRLEIAFGASDEGRNGYLFSTVAKNGERVSDYDERFTSELMRSERITIRVNLNMDGKTGSACVQTCDLTHGYITINGDYRS